MTSPSAVSLPFIFDISLSAAATLVACLGLGQHRCTITIELDWLVYNALTKKKLTNVVSALV